MDRWLAGLEGQRRPSTIYAYRQSLFPVRARIGETRLDRLTPVQLTGTFADLRRSDVGSSRTKMAYVTFGTCLRSAVRLGVIGSNPLDRVEPPQHRPPGRRYWTADQARRFLAIVPDSNRRYAPLFLLLLATGMRKGEALALRWSDIDLARNTVAITRSLVWTKAVLSLQPPKTLAGERKVTLPPIAVDGLRRLPQPIDPDTLVFTTREGMTPTESTLREAFRASCRVAGVPVMPIHGLRHVHAALLVHQGVDLHTLRRRLGHSRIDMSLNVYAYAVGSDSAAAAAFDRALMPSGREEEAR
jgi:integrase